MISRKGNRARAREREGERGRGPGRGRAATAGLVAAAVTLAAPILFALREAAKEEPAPFEAAGRLVCLAEVLRDEWRAEVPPIHDHIWGFKVANPTESATRDSFPKTTPDGASAAAGPAYLVLLRTPIAEGLFADEQFREKTMVLRGRVFPRTSLAEVTSYGWIRDGKRYELYYWCDVCSIRGRNPASCACCQAKVELREEPSR